MSKRRIERELDEHEEMLESLSLDERLQVYFQAVLKEDDDWKNRLVETCPQQQRRAFDHATMTGRRDLLFLSLQALYELHETLWVYRYLTLKDHTCLVLDHAREQPLTDEESEERQQRVNRLFDLYGELYAQYHGYRQFVEAEFDVDLETLLELRSNGTDVLEQVTEVLEMSALNDRSGEEHFEADSEDRVRLSLDEMAEQYAELYAHLWSEMTVDL